MAYRPHCASRNRRGAEALPNTGFQPTASSVRSCVASTSSKGDRLTEEELVATVLFLFSAGHSTTRDLVGNGLLALLRHPDQWHGLVADPTLLPVAVEECLRYDSPVTMIPRTALVDMTVRGMPIAAGEQVWVSLNAANRDPARFVDPDRFALDRPDNEHLAFGGGIHYCLGAGLARTEAQIIFGALRHRYPHFELAEEHIEWRVTFSFRGPVTLHVSW